ncbi:uncharacterized protein EV420DRAFT_1641322 [Desarmillaria tabescens]|uniref:F-box domain-containing protein n=1 Tax=Armillaria tabescens TaxID=1929756 RepID=A0AA39KIQ1_ARMTA|nr:uncharacterized protein EV420DRAFT_1641322 [Desarmillaria tabescens]KAK0459973.1 hypothetical protein EV420DRAFT_1641322 [Desarmillaria tabescens]
MAPALLPQELIDSILDHLHDDIPALRQCVLVSHSFHAATQGHLYHQVVLVHYTWSPHMRKPYTGAWYTCANFYQLICHSPHIPPLVKSFVVHDGLLGNDSYDQTTKRLFNKKFLPLIFPLLPCPRRIVLMNRSVRLGINNLPRSLKSSIRDAFRSPHITIIHLDGLEQVDQGWLLSLFEGCPSLKHLTLTWFNESRRHSFPLSEELLVKPINTSPALEALSFADEVSFIVDELFMMQPLFNISRLRKLSIHSRSRTDCRIIQKLLNATQDCLEELILRTQGSLPSTHLFLPVLPGLGPHAQALDISGNTKLRTVYLVVNAKYPDWPMTIPFSTILQGLTIEAAFWPGRSAAGIERLNWSSLDAYVSQRMPSLCNINVKLHAANKHADDCTSRVCTGRTRSGDKCMIDAVKYVHKHLPTLNNMGTLQIEETSKRTTWSIDDTLCSSVF